ncbi:MAG: 2-nitropropane dioxygenase-like protein [Ornithinibacter sp.]|jgi:hypothetical protein|nr:2-nitropropane dioxygenase-like protein [Ornithinibacter sp.]
MTELVERTIPVSVRIRMAHAAVQTLATQHLVDLLHIKGVSLDPRLAFPGRSSADADVLCRPEHVERLLLAMRESGWSLLNTFTKSSAFEHSATLHHPTWGWLDLHRRYPGLGRDPATAFDTLWATRGVATIAGVPCAVPAPSDQAVLLLLHAARSPGELKARSDVAHVWGSATPESRDAILSSVDRLGADLAFAVILGTLDEHRDDPEYALWRIASAGGTRLDEWRARVRAARGLRAKMRVVARSTLVNDEHLALTGRPTGPKDLVVEFFARPIRGAKEQYVVVRSRRRGRRRADG